MRMWQSRRGSPIFSYLVVFVAVIALTMAFGVIAGATNKMHEIGTKQMRLLGLYQSGEETLFYTEQSARYSAYQAIPGLAGNGGYAVEGTCKSIKGYVLWNTKEGAECYPTAESLNPELTVSMEKTLSGYLSVYGSGGLDKNAYVVRMIATEPLALQLVPQHGYNLVLPIKSSDELLIEPGKAVDASSYPAALEISSTQQYIQCQNPGCGLEGKQT